MLKVYFKAPQTVNILPLFPLRLYSSPLGQVGVQGKVLIA